jgi:hypothetical protein
MRLLVIPTLTKQAAASPFHGYFVSPGSKRAFVHALRTMLTTGVSPIQECRSVTAVTGVCIGSKIVILSILDQILDKFSGQSCTSCAQALIQHARTALLDCFLLHSTGNEIDKPRSAFENRSFSFLRRGSTPSRSRELESGRNPHC